MSVLMTFIRQLLLVPGSLQYLALPLAWVSPARMNHLHRVSALAFLQAMDVKVLSARPVLYLRQAFHSPLAP